MEYYFWVGLFAPKGTPASVIAVLRDAVRTAAHGPQYAEALENLGQELDYPDAPDFAAFWDADAARIEAAVRMIGRVPG